jgi:hypothetical protein
MECLHHSYFCLCYYISYVLLASRCNKIFATEKLKGKADYSKCGHKMLHPNRTVKMKYNYFAERLVNAYSLNLKKAIPGSCHKEILVGD